MRKPGVKNYKLGKKTARLPKHVRQGKKDRKKKHLMSPQYGKWRF